MKSLTVYRFSCAAAIALIITLGLGTKFYIDWTPFWVGDFIGDALYEMAWIWFFGALKIRWRVSVIAIAVFLTTSLIEFSQLIAFPNAWTSQLWWRLLLGTHFAPADFLYYAIGSIFGAISLDWLRKQTIQSHP